MEATDVGARVSSRRRGRDGPDEPIRMPGAGGAPDGRQCLPWGAAVFCLSCLSWPGG